MVTRKERLLKKYLDKKRKQHDRDELYKQIVALNKQKDIDQCERKGGERISISYEVRDEIFDGTIKSNENDVEKDGGNLISCDTEGDGMRNLIEDGTCVMETWNIRVRNMVSETEGLECQEEDVPICTDTELKQREGCEVVIKKYEPRAFGNRRKEMEEYRKLLPIYYEQVAIICAARRVQVLFIKGMTGCGKTTQVPQFLYEGGFAAEGMIGITQPRRISAISVANRINEETNEEVCGYKIKYESTVRSTTKIKVMTDGVLLREVCEDFLLSSYSVVIIDEVHERSINIDLLISIIPKVIKLRKERELEFKLVLMSATGDVEEFKKFFEEMEVFECPWQEHRVSVFHEERTEADYLNVAYNRVMSIVFSGEENRKRRKFRGKKKEIIGCGIQNDKEAAILVFLAGKQDIYKLRDRLNDSSLDMTVLPLHSSLSKAEQHLVFEKANSRKIILATNVAETSITIPDVVFVVDSGRVKNKTIYGDGLVKYSVDFITKSSALQRMGRAGRTGPGVCYRLYSGRTYEMFHDSTTPQILREPLDSVVLCLLRLGIRKIHRFPFLLSPGETAINRAINCLQNFGALDKSLMLTDIGKMMSKYPIEPRLARLLCTRLSEDIFVELVTVVSLAAVDLEVRRNSCTQEYFEGSGSDFLVRFKIYKDFLNAKDKRGFSSKVNLNHLILLEASKMVNSLLEISKHGSRRKILSTSPDVLSKIRRVLYCGFSDRLAVPSSASWIFNTEEVVPSENSISVESKDFVVFDSLVFKNNKMYMRNITIVDKDWF